MGGGNTIFSLRMHFRFGETSHDAYFFREARIPSYLANKKETRSIGSREHAEIQDSSMDFGIFDHILDNRILVDPCLNLEFRYVPVVRLT